ncbi:hypothetical protein WJ17_03685 [Burkholderia vietnamiensis]|nr:hypothetical protein WJ17_03685 [Burkholderia vietnamiensis]
MPLYYVTALTNPDKILAVAKEVTKDQPTDLHEVAPDKFFIKFDGTTVELGERLGINEGVTGQGIILAVGAYHGRAPKSLWEWVSQKLNAK